MNKSKFIIIILFLLILLFGTFLRFYKITEEGFWLDELFQINATLNPLSEMFDYLPKDKPQLDYIIQHFFMKFGNDEFHARLHAAIFGILSIIAIFFLGKRLYGERVGLISAFLLSISPVHIYYSQEGRPYSLFFLLVILLHYFFYGAVIKNENIKRNWIGYWITAVLAVYTLYFFFIIFMLQMIVLFFICFYLKQGNIRDHLKYLLFISILIILIFIINSKKMQSGAELYSEARDEEILAFSFFQFYSSMNALLCGYRTDIYYRYASSIYVVPLLIGLVIGFFKDRKPTSYLTFIYISFTILNLIIYYILDAHFCTRYSLTNLIPIIVILAFCIDSIAGHGSKLFSKNEKHISGRNFVYIFIIIILLSLITWNYLSFLNKPRNAKPKWRELTEFLKDNSDNEDIIIVSDGSDLWPLLYYKIRYNFNNQLYSSDGSVDFVKEYMNKSKKLWLVSRHDYKLNLYNQWLIDLHNITIEGSDKINGYIVHKWENKVLILKDDPVEFNKYADLFEKSKLIDIGFNDEGFIWENWEVGEKWGDMTIRWAKNSYSSLCVPLNETRNLRLLINVCPFSDAKIPQKQKMKIIVNDVEVQTVELENSMGLYKVDVPEKFWKSGVNVLRFEFAYAISPNSISDKEDPRKLSAAFDYIKFEKY